jgi:hypothetical protein
VTEGLLLVWACAMIAAMAYWVDTIEHFHIWVLS